MRRRDFLTAAAAAVTPLRAAAAPASPVAVSVCRDYGASLLPSLEKMFDQLGGLGRLVNGKTVVMKVNLTGSPTYRLGYSALGDTHYTHPRVIGAVTHLMGKAGAKRVRIVESPWATADPLEEYMYQANWDPDMILKAAPKVEFENTNFLGEGKQYVRFKVPGGGSIYPSYDLNHSYADCDVFVSLAKMKEHATAGVTLSMKNCFGITPCTIYGAGAGEQEPSEVPRGGRSMFHSGHRQPSKSAAQELPNTPRDGGGRVPRIVADICAARPIHLAIVESVITMAGGEGPWIPNCRTVKPGLLVAGLNPVCTDAVCTSLMGYDPMAARGSGPFGDAENTMELGEKLGLGTRDLRKIEVIGPKVETVRFDFRKARPRQRWDA